MECPEDMDIMFLHDVLPGKAKNVYCALSTEQCENYQFVKETILQVNELVPEAYSQNFRSYRDIKYVEFARDKENICGRWY